MDGSVRNHPGYTPPAPRPPFIPELGPVARPASKQSARGAHNNRGCRFPPVLNSHHTGHDQLIAPVVSPLQTAERDQERASSVVHHIGEATRMVEEDRNLSFSDSERKNVLRDLAVLKKYFRRSLCFRISVYILVAVMIVSFCSWIVALIVIVATKK